MLTDDDDEDLTQQGRIVGTPRYMAPEQALGLPVDHRADIYSLGVLLYHLLTGTAPFQDNSSAMLMMKHAQEIPETFSQRLGPGGVEGLPSGLEAVVMKALSKKPGRRQQNVDALRTELELVMPTMSSSFSHITPPVPPSPPPMPGPAGHSSEDAVSEAHLASPVQTPNPSLDQSAQALAAPDTTVHPNESWPVVQRYQSTPVDSPHPPDSSARPPRTSSDAFADAAPPSRIGRVLVAIGALGVILLLAALSAGAIIWHKTNREPDTPPAGSDKAVVPVQDVGAQAEVLSLRVASSPEDATVFFGREDLGRTPLVIEVDPGVPTARYEVRKEGFAPASREFVVADLSEDSEWQVTLQPLAAEIPDVEAPVEQPPPVSANTTPGRKKRRTTRPRPKLPRSEVDSAEKSDAVSAVATLPSENATVEDKTPPASATRKPKVDLLDIDAGRKPTVGILGSDPKTTGKEKRPKVEVLE
jgi:hypothetical protein